MLSQLKPRVKDEFGTITVPTIPTTKKGRLNSYKRIN
jgi:hypothetical protein